MDRERPSDPLLVEIYSLLKRLAFEDRGAGGSGPGGDSPWHGHYSSGEERWPLSATELLVSWSPGEAGAGGAPNWDRYLSPPPQRQAGARGFESALSFMPGSIVVPASDILGDGETVGAEIAAAGDNADPDAAAAAVDGLFALVHALERRDLEALMEGVADDFHALEGDREIDRRSLRQLLEGYVDRRREGEWRVSLTEVPHPVFHPLGILIRATLQVDYSDVEGAKRTDLISRLAVFGESAPGVWRLSGMADVG